MTYHRIDLPMLDRFARCEFDASDVGRLRESRYSRVLLMLSEIARDRPELPLLVDRRGVDLLLLVDRRVGRLLREEVLRLVVVLGLGHVRHRLGILRGKFAQAFFVELNTTLVAVAFAFEFKTALLHLADLMFQLGKALAK